MTDDTNDASVLGVPATQPGEIAQILQEGRAAALAGDTFAARASFRRATELDPHSPDAWIGLSSVVPVLAEKYEYLKRALALDPTNGEARASLAYIERLQAEGLQLAPAQRRQVREETNDTSPLLSAPESATQVETLYCYLHPDRETGLRCIQCNRPICGACAQITPVGQLCPECRKVRRPRNYQPELKHIVIAGLTGVVIGLLASIVLPIVTRLPFLGLFLALMLGPAVGDFAVRMSDRLTRTKRGRPMQIALGAGIAVGTAPLMLILILSPSLLTAITLLYTVLAVTTAVARLR